MAQSTAPSDLASLGAELAQSRRVSRETVFVADTALQRRVQSSFGAASILSARLLRFIDQTCLDNPADLDLVREHTSEPTRFLGDDSALGDSTEIRVFSPTTRAEPGSATIRSIRHFEVGRSAVVALDETAIVAPTPRVEIVVRQVRGRDGVALQQGGTDVSPSARSLGSMARLNAASSLERELGVDLSASRRETVEVGRHIVSALFGDKGDVRLAPADLGWYAKQPRASVSFDSRFESSRRFTVPSIGLKGRVVSEIVESRGVEPFASVRIEIPTLDSNPRSIASYAVKMRVEGSHVMIERAGEHGHPLDRA